MRLLEFRYVKTGAPEADFPDASDVLGALRLKQGQRRDRRHAQGRQGGGGCPGMPQSP